MVWKGLSAWARGWAWALALALPVRAGTPPQPGLPPESKRLLPNFQLSSFGTLGLAATDTHRVQFRRDSSEPGGAIDHPTPSVDTRLGLQLSSRFADDWLATVQVLSRQRYDGSWRPDLTWASLTWTPGRNWEFKFGRLENERMPNWDYANVGYTLLWVRPPVEQIGNHDWLYTDGMFVSRTFYRGDTTLVASLFGGFMDEKSPAALGTYPYDDTGSALWGGALKFRRGGLRGRFSAIQIRAANNFRPTGFDADAFLDGLDNPGLNQVAARFRPKGHLFRGFDLGAAYERGPFQIEGSISRSTSDLGSIPDIWAGFLSFGYRVGAVVPYGFFSRAVSKRFSDPDVQALNGVPGFGPTLAALLTRAAHAQEADQWTFAAGLRWDFAPTADLKIQVDRVHAHNSTVFWVVDQPGWNGQAWVMSIVVDFVFGGVR